MALPVGAPSRFNVPAWILQREAAVGALKGETALNYEKSFMEKAELKFPEVKIEGALSATGLGWHDAKTLHRFVDVAALWGFGDFDQQTGCSSYYDQRSPWFNAFYGGYAMRSHKGGRVAWGYDENGQVKFDELFEICAIDYNFITAGAFGCPFEKMCFAVRDFTAGKVDKWDVADVYAVAPSGLHDPKKQTQPGEFFDLSSYLVFGIPHPALQTGEDFPAVPLAGQFYMRQLETDPNNPPITLAWGAACHDTPEGRTLLKQIMNAMKKEYSKL